MRNSGASGNGNGCGRGAMCEAYKIKRVEVVQDIGTGCGKGAKCETHSRKPETGVRVVMKLGVDKGQNAKNIVGNGKQGCEWCWNWACAWGEVRIIKLGTGNWGASGSGTGRGQGPKCEEYSRKREAGVRVVVELGVGVGRRANHIVGNGKQGCEW